MGHEIGHTFGGDHDRTTVNNSNTMGQVMYDYGFGYRLPNTNKHTILA